MSGPRSNNWPRRRPDLSKAADSGSLGKPGQSVADALARDHAAPAELVKKLRELPPARALRFGTGPVWLLDRVDGTLGCHTMLAVAVPAFGPAHEVALPPLGENVDLCALSALAAVSIGGDPALWIEQSGAFSDARARSAVTIAALRADGFAPPCTVTIDYAVTEQATHAFCDGIDCVPLIRTAELLAMRLRNGETAETLGAGVVSPGMPEDAADYRRMAAIVAADTQPLDLPTFGVSLDTPYTAFSDPVSFPLRLAGRTDLSGAHRPWQLRVADESGHVAGGVPVAGRSSGSRRLGLRGGAAERGRGCVGAGSVTREAYGAGSRTAPHACQSDLSKLKYRLIYRFERKYITNHRRNITAAASCTGYAGCALGETAHVPGSGLIYDESGRPIGFCTEDHPGRPVSRRTRTGTAKWQHFTGCGAASQTGVPRTWLGRGRCNSGRRDQRGD